MIFPPCSKKISYVLNRSCSCISKLLGNLLAHPHLESSRGNPHFVADIILVGTHLIGLLQRDAGYLIHLLIKRQENSEDSLMEEVSACALYIYQIYLQKALARRHPEHAFCLVQRWEGRKSRVGPLGRTLRSNDTPNLPLSRCSAI